MYIHIYGYIEDMYVWVIYIRHVYIMKTNLRYYISYSKYVCVCMH